MKKLLLLLPVLLWLSAVPASYGDDDEASWLSFFDHKNEVAPVRDATYKKECGACHFPYQPGWLPQSSWQKLLAPSALADHFGEDAELPETTRRHILDYALLNAADKSSYKRSKKIMASLDKGEAPTRITEVTYIRRKHHEIPAALIKGDKVKSLSFCDACHTKAAEGVFDEDTVVIPGKGKWSW